LADHFADPFADLIEPFSRRGVDLGLDRLQAALAELGHPERQFAAVQVAGTNGKGSIATLVHSSLLAAGINAGLYTSPHLVSWCERIRIGKSPISEAALRHQLEALQNLGQSHQLTPFELVTAAAFCAFARAGCPLVVLEVGLGGRLDATTCHPDRSVVGFGSIGLDHREFLGPTSAAIAAEKAGVLQRGCTALSAAQNQDVAAVLEQRANACGAELRWVEPLDLDQWSLGIPGTIQASNGAVALGMLHALAERGWAIGDNAIRTGFGQAHWPGRLQPLQWRGRELLLDGAHNPPAAEALRLELDLRATNQGDATPGRHWVLGMLANKAAPEILNILLAPGDRAWIVPVPGHASWSTEALQAACPTWSQALESAPDLEGALGQATAANQEAAAGQSSPPVLVAGSLYLIGHLLATVAPELRQSD
jgi:dihydrofolate synthase/folylpolyglutamate synthase